jgi:hypothetical protein
VFCIFITTVLLDSVLSFTVAVQHSYHVTQRHSAQLQKVFKMNKEFQTELTKSTSLLCGLNCALYVKLGKASLYSDNEMQFSWTLSAPDSCVDVAVRFSPTVLLLEILSRLQTVLLLESLFLLLLWKNLLLEKTFCIRKLVDYNLKVSHRQFFCN